MTNRSAEPIASLMFLSSMKSAEAEFLFAQCRKWYTSVEESHLPVSGFRAASSLTEFGFHAPANQPPNCVEGIGRRHRAALA